jgi:very-short-patch-repair endonuclease
MRDKVLTERARFMRKEMSEPETQMWLALRAKRFESVKFRRQKVVGNYIVDFAARDPMLVIEIDGDSHGETAVYDADRTRYLESCGYRVVRFGNSDVMTNLEGVLTELQRVIETAPLPTLSPEGERA